MIGMIDNCTDQDDACCGWIQFTDDLLHMVCELQSYIQNDATL